MFVKAKQKYFIKYTTDKIVKNFVANFRNYETTSLVGRIRRVATVRVLCCRANVNCNRCRTSSDTQRPNKRIHDRYCTVESTCRSR